METRKITIINSKTQSQKVIENSQATTLGELKAEMRQLGIDYSGMAFMEGHIRAELKDDASILPTNIPYKGQVVNDLTFLLTAPEKKIKSGAMTRNELISKAKELGFPSNPTQAKSAVLLDFIESKSLKKEKEVNKEKVVKTKKVEKVEKTCCGNSMKGSTLNEAIEIISDALYNSGILNESQYRLCMESVGMKPKKKEGLSDSEIKEMFNFVER